MSTPRSISNEVAVVVDSVSKSFSLPTEKVHTFKERALHPFKRTQFNRFSALKDVSFEVKDGEFFGIVGRNGSGKSTLLKCLAGIYSKDSGSMKVRGRMSTFIELGVGFNPDLAARDNATLNGIMLGLSKKEAESRYDQILDFSELHEFEDLKVKNYSSGMLVRLAFSVMIQVNADVLLIDEVLAVGDAAFQQKCFDEFNRLRDEQRTILFVTHDMSAVQRYCDRALLLEKGDVRIIDSPDAVANLYFKMNFSPEQAAAATQASADQVEPVQQEESEDTSALHRGDGKAEIIEGWFEDKNGVRATTLAQGKPCSYTARIRFHDKVKDPILAVILEDGDHRPVFASSSVWQGQETGSFSQGEEVMLRVEFDNYFAPSRYWVTTQVAHRGSGNAFLDRRERMSSVVVTGSRSAGGLVDLPHDFRIERVDTELRRAPSPNRDASCTQLRKSEDQTEMLGVTDGAS